MKKTTQVIQCDIFISQLEVKYHLKGSLNHPKKVAFNDLDMFFSLLAAKQHSKGSFAFAMKGTKVLRNVSFVQLVGGFIPPPQESFRIEMFEAT